MTMWRMRIECCVPKATNTITEYVLFITFQLQQWLNKQCYVIVPCMFVFVNGFYSKLTNLRMKLVCIL
jgi:hypothetical protein